MAGYDFAAIEGKWQRYWDEHGTFRQPNPGEEGFDGSRRKFYVLDMFPYPSGEGLHVGHGANYTGSDIVARYLRMKGCNVLHPTGYDAFGLPAEQYAVQRGVHPAGTTARNIASIQRQMKMCGFSYDWSRVLATTDPEYYRWTQWIFLKMYNSWFDPQAGAARPIAELTDRLIRGDLVVDIDGNLHPVSFLRKVPQISLLAAPFGDRKFAELAPDQQRRLMDEYRLAYVAEVPVNWCPQLGTVLANEEVTSEGRSERGDYPVYRRAMKQWMLRITAYAERLLTGLDKVDWPVPIKVMQRNWIGRSTGAEVDLPVVGPTGVPPVGEATPAFRQGAQGEGRFLLTARSFEARNPYPPGEPSPTDLIGGIRHFPHLELPGATYFVTFHAARGQEFSQPERERVFQACRHWHGSRCCLYAVVVVSNHVHMLVKPLGGARLSELLHSIKSFTAHDLNRRREVTGTVWKQESFDHIVRDSRWFTAFIDYICQNPVKYGLAPRFDSYRWLWVNADEVMVEETGHPFGNSAPAGGRHVLDEWFRRRAEEGFPRQTEMDFRDDEDGDRRDACRTSVIRVYTTRPDTLFGATYMVLAPEHPLVERITAPGQRQAVSAYVEQAGRKSELERMAETKEKTGIFTGAFAVNPVNRREIPVWVADYVMMGYGTGAIMAVPAHDTRDLQFAEKFGLEVVQVVQPPAGADWRGYVDEGTAVNSGRYDGLPTPEFKEKITEDLSARGLARAAVNYKLRDWLFSRQRYWGEPFPIVHCPACGVVDLPEEQLPLTLPEMEDFTPAASDDPEALPEPPLGKAADWVKTVCPRCGGPARRELNTMPQWAGSCWYYLRFLDPKNDRAFCDPAVEKYWMAPPSDKSEIRPYGRPYGRNPKSEIGGVDLYVGGAEHAVLHLLYARFWHKVLYDLGYVSTDEPFGKLFNQGMIRSFAYRDRRGVYVPYEDVDVSGEAPRHKTTGEELSESVEKMSKSLKNVVNPDEVIARYGADTFRLYEMFMGPLEASKPWNTRDVPGVHRFLHRVWRMLVGGDDRPGLLTDGDGQRQVEIALHRLVKKVGDDIEAMKFNTAIAAMMEFVNTVYREGRITVSQAERFVLVLAPFAPHLAEELWQRLGHDRLLAHEAWPEHDESLLAAETVGLAVQVNGKVRGRITVPADADEQTIVQAALADARVAPTVAGKTIVRKVVVPGRLVNLVVK